MKLTLRSVQLTAAIMTIFVNAPVFAETAQTNSNDGATYDLSARSHEGGGGGGSSSRGSSGGGFSSPRPSAPAYTPRASTPAPTYTPRPSRSETPRVSTPRIAPTPTYTPQPSRSENPRVSVPSIPNTRREERPRVSVNTGSGQSSNHESRRQENHQGGISGQYSHATFTGSERRVNGNTVERQTSNGDLVRYSHDRNGQEHISSVVRTDNSGHQRTVRYDDSGRRTGYTVNNGNSRVEAHIGRNGTSHVVQTFNDGHRVVTNSRGGYVERTVVRNNRNYLQRTYVDRVSHRTYVRNYYYDGGYRYYAPAWRYENAFWSGFIWGSLWATQPVYYPYYTGWTWYGNSWVFSPYSPYSGYFAPEVYYADSADWIADYVIADTIAAAMEEQQDQIDSLRRNVRQLEQQNQIATQADLQRNANNALIDKEIKKQIAAQVKEELQAQQNQRAVPMTRALTDTKYLFLSSQEIDASYTAINSETGQSEDKECTIAQGDIFHLNQAVGNGEQIAKIKMTTVKHSSESCPVGQELVISVDSLQSIKNDLARRAEDGVKAAHDQQGRNGLPMVSSQAAQSLVDESSADQQQAVQELQQVQSENQNQED